MLLSTEHPDHSENNMADHIKIHINAYISSTIYDMVVYMIRSTIDNMIGCRVTDQEHRSRLRLVTSGPHQERVQIDFDF